MIAQRTWPDRIGTSSARLRTAYVSLWVLFVLLVILMGICGLIGFPSSQNAAIALYICMFIAVVVAGIAQDAVGRKVQATVSAYLDVPPGRRFPVRALLNKGDFDRWVATLPHSGN